MSRIPFLILSFLDFVVYVVMTLIFPTNQGKRASSSKNVAILLLLFKRAITAPNKLIDSLHYKRHRRKRTIEFHPRSHSILTITRLNPSVLKNFKLLQNDPETNRIFLQPPLISFKRDKNIGNFLVRSAFLTNDQPGTVKCARARCKICPFIRNAERISGPSCKRSLRSLKSYTSSKQEDDWQPIPRKPS